MQASNIMIVEDEMIVARDIQYTLKEAGYEVVCVTDTAKEAVEKAEACCLDLIIMDIMLNGEADGIEAAEKILANHV